jgi:hypothetical protein
MDHGIGDTGDEVADGIVIGDVGHQAQIRGSGDFLGVIAIGALASLERKSLVVGVGATQNSRVERHNGFLSWAVFGADSRRICWADAKMPGGLEPPGTVFSTCNKHGIFGGKTGTVCQVYFLFRFSWLRGFSTGEGLDKGRRGAPEMVHCGVTQDETGARFTGWRERVKPQGLKAYRFIGALGGGTEPR